MRSTARHIAASTTRKELILLLLAAFSVVMTLTIVVSGISGSASGGFHVRQAILAAVVAALSLFVVTGVWRITRAALRETKATREQNIDLRRQVTAADAIIKTEPQVIVFWEQGQAMRIVTHTLATVAGVPEAQVDLVRFAQWLAPASAEALKAGLDALFEQGIAFSVILKTKAGANVEAEGRAAGGRAVLRLRDVTGFKRDLARIRDLQDILTRDVRSSRALLDALPMPVWMKGPDERIRWANEAYIAAVEAANMDEIVDRQIELLEQRQRKMVARKLTSGERFRERLPLVVGKERRAHDVVVLPVEDTSIAAAMDVTALESVQGELDRQIAAYDRTLDRVGTAVAIFNRDQALVFFNKAYQTLWQIDADWLAKRPTDGAVLDRLRDLGRLPDVVNYREWKTKVLACYQSGTDFEDWWHLPDGRFIHVMGEQRPDGGVTYLFADETERFALESRYNALIDVQSETLDGLKEGVAVFGTDGRLKLFNSAFATIWQIHRRILVERPHIDEVIQLSLPLYNNPQTWLRIGQAVTSFLVERAVVEGQMVRPDSTVIDYTAMPLPDGATLLTFADVTDAKHYERALVERNEALVAADRLKNQFIGHVSYELRTPLTTIIGFSDLLASEHIGTLNAKQREYLSDINSSSRTLLAIINDILDLATIDAGGLELKLGVVDVNAVIDAAILGVREAAIRKQLTLDIAISSDAKTFVADEARVRQMAYNLLSNAVGFSSQGGTVMITCWREAGMMVFSVEDQGVGIPLEQQPHVFERFESRSHGSAHRGAGLGLSIARSLVELHGGTMTLQSEPGKGTCVTFRLPEHGRSPQAARAGVGDASPPLAASGSAA